MEAVLGAHTSLQPPRRGSGARAARLAGCILLAVLALTWGAWGDTLVVAGQQASSRHKFPVVGEEVYAPILPALSLLGAKYELTPEAIKITTATGREVLLSLTRAEATLDGMMREVPGPPRKEGKVYLLPARAVGSLLGCAVRWDADSRTLFLHPWVRRFSLERLADRYRLRVGAEAPVLFHTGRLENPPRFYLDLVNADLADIPSEFTADGGYLRGARASQNSLSPAPEGDVIRVVVELEEWRPYRFSVTPDRCEARLDFPLPDADEVPPEAAPVVLTDLNFQRLSARLAAVRLSVYGKATCRTGTTEDPPSIWVEVANADVRMPTRHISPRDRWVSDVSVDPVPDQPRRQRLTIELEEPISHSVVSEQGEVRVLLGRTELADLTVVIDPGHGGHDTGAIGRTGLQEKEVNLSIALRVRQLLQALGAKVLMTRTTDAPVVPWTRGNREEHRRELLARCAIANKANADLFVSIHANARARNPGDTSGTETYYRKSDSIELARVIQEELVKAAGLLDGGVIRHPKPIVVLYQTNMPAVLVEVGYLSHPDDEAQLATDAFREKAAEGIANGIRRYVEEGGILARMAEREARQARGTQEGDSQE